jgi:hypothetical protein
MNPLHLNSFQVNAQQSSIPLQKDATIPEHINKISEDVDSKFSQNLDTIKNNIPHENNFISHNVSNNGSTEPKQVPTQKDSLEELSKSEGQQDKPKSKRPTMKKTESILVKSDLISSEKIKEAKEIEVQEKETNIQEKSVKIQEKSVEKENKGNVKIEENILKEESTILNNTEVKTENTEVKTENTVIAISKAEIARVLSDVDKAMQHTHVPKVNNGQFEFKNGQLVFTHASSISHQELHEFTQKKQIALNFGKTMIYDPKAFPDVKITGIVLEEKDGSFTSCAIQHFEEKEIEEFSKTIKNYFVKYNIQIQPANTQEKEDKDDKTSIDKYNLMSYQLKQEQEKRYLEDHKIYVFHGGGKSQNSFDVMILMCQAASKRRHEHEKLEKVHHETAARIYIDILKFERNAEMKVNDEINKSKTVNIYVLGFRKEKLEFTLRGRSKIIRSGN